MRPTVTDENGREYFVDRVPSDIADALVEEGFATTTTTTTTTVAELDRAPCRDDAATTGKGASNA